MTDDRNEQIQKMVAVLGGGHVAKVAAEDLYDAGARIPDAPPPEPNAPEVVVTEQAVNAYLQSYPLGGYEGLREAFAHLLAANTGHPLVRKVVEEEIRRRVVKLPWERGLKRLEGRGMTLATAVCIAPDNLLTAIGVTDTTP